MQTAQRIISNYRRKRILVCVLVAVSMLLLTLGARFISERNLNQQRLLSFTSHAIFSLDTVLAAVEHVRPVLLPLVGKPCDDVHLRLRTEAASLQTLRSIGLVDNGILYCSSIFGFRNVPVRQLQPLLPDSEPRLILSTDQSLLKGSPILIQWFPAVAGNDSGVMVVVNITLLTNLMLEPQKPLITGASLTVNNRHLLYGAGVVDTLPALTDEKRFSQSSARYPFTVNVRGPGASELALRHLPSQFPLALLLSLLVGFIAWVVTANRMSFAWEIHLGLAENEFELFCQPLLDAQTQQCVGVEILLRWNNRRQGWISPDVFIPIAENQGLIAPLTRYVLTETHRQLALFPPSPHFHIGINVAASHFGHGELIADLNHHWFHVRPVQQLVIELTERDSLSEADFRIVRELHRMGVKVAIDDFGTGNTSLSWLEKLSPDILKIDKSYINAIGTDAVNSTVTDMIIALGKRLKLEMVAEGVETPQQAAYLRLRGVHVLQGYLYAKPMPLKDFPGWLAASIPPPARHNGKMMPSMPLQ
ncbi:EAL domain-containing protein [Enterobacter kobei]|uniref:Cyclic diguanylate phosphodiesterase n=2 Tax=Enterobacter kobei TaxID=208224 RepID=A0ACC8SCW6_9ENTR|nr:EAL domain-containing protein [Enterobacter kobei]OLR21271.1 cyclic diguanylate phosphodiesterase [Enterobacter kobei]BCU55369.1 diguanylate phosphodiesterase [Enterobacter kobei]SIQ88046.1 sensor c-di-GMP phosphodiesterase, contains CSS-motif sensor and EAL domain [Enterobacter kobei]